LTAATIASLIVIPSTATGVQAAKLVRHPFEISRIGALIENTRGIHHLATFKLFAEQRAEAHPTIGSLLRRVTVLGPGFINSHLR
jgi:hypothetical protein